MSNLIYFIRAVDTLSPEDVAAPRTLDTLRRSLDGELCIVAYDEDQVPTGWVDGMSAEQCMATIGAPDAQGVWWSAE